MRAGSCFRLSVFLPVIALAGCSSGNLPSNGRPDAGAPPQTGSSDSEAPAKEGEDVPKQETGPTRTDFAELSVEFEWKVTGHWIPYDLRVLSDRVIVVGKASGFEWQGVMQPRGVYAVAVDTGGDVSFFRVTDDQGGMFQIMADGGILLQVADGVILPDTKALTVARGTARLARLESDGALRWSAITSSAYPIQTIESLPTLSHLPVDDTRMLVSSCFYGDIVYGEDVLARMAPDPNHCNLVLLEVSDETGALLRYHYARGEVASAINGLHRIADDRIAVSGLVSVFGTNVPVDLNPMGEALIITNSSDDDPSFNPWIGVFDLEQFTFTEAYSWWVFNAFAQVRSLDAGRFGFLTDASAEYGPHVVARGEELKVEGLAPTGVAGRLSDAAPAALAPWVSGRGQILSSRGNGPHLEALVYVQRGAALAPGTEQAQRIPPDAAEYGRLYFVELGTDAKVVRTRHLMSVEAEGDRTPYAADWSDSTMYLFRGAQWRPFAARTPEGRLIVDVPEYDNSGQLICARPPASEQGG